MDENVDIQKLLEENKKLKEQLDKSNEKKDKKKDKKLRKEEKKTQKKEKKQLKKENKKLKKDNKKPRKLKKKALIIIIILVVLLLAGAGVASFFIIKNSKFNIDSFKKNVVLIIAYDEDGEPFGTGSGVYVNNTTIYTNAHVVDGAKMLEVVLDDNMKVEVKGIQTINKDKDIAILVTEKVDGVKTLKTKSKVKVGTEVYAVGSPLGLKNTVSDGVISSEYEEKSLGDNVYQHTAPISPGSSGGALINKKGELIGINFASYEEGQNLNLAIKIDSFNEEYEKTKDDKLMEVSTSSLFEVDLLMNKPGKDIIKEVCSIDLNCFAGIYTPNYAEAIEKDVEQLIVIGPFKDSNNYSSKNWLYIYLFEMKQRTDENDASFKKIVDTYSLNTRNNFPDLDFKHYWAINNNYYYYIEYGKDVDITNIVSNLMELTGGAYE